MSWSNAMSFNHTVRYAITFGPQDSYYSFQAALADGLWRLSSSTGIVITYYREEGDDYNSIMAFETQHGWSPYSMSLLESLLGRISRSFIQIPCVRHASASNQQSVKPIVLYKMLPLT
ncbi:hypothetical protein L204_100502 [Cryptococcus depauperatus]